MHERARARFLEGCCWCCPDWITVGPYGHQVRAPKHLSHMPATFEPAFRAQLADLFAWRRDVRRFRPDPLPPGILEHLLALACRAPSVGLSQPWRFVLINSPDRRRA